MDDDRLEYMGGRDLLDGGLITSMMVPTAHSQGWGD